MVELKQREIIRIVPKEELSKEEREKLIFEGDKDDSTSN